MKVDLIEIWLTTMGASHSDSERTKVAYRKDFKRYLEFTQTTPEKILEEYSQNDIIQGNQIIRMREQVIQNHTRAIVLYLAKLRNEGYLPSSRQNAVHAIRSFYKYNNLPLGHIEVGKQRVILHNRDITKEEIEEIIRVAQPRERAFYALLVQSGLRPQTLCLLKIGDIEGITEENTPIPSLIKVSEEQTKGQYGSYWSFVGKESIDYLKEYLKRRNQPLNPEEYLFTHDKDNTSPINTDIISHIFRRSVVKLKKEGVIDFKNKETAKANRNEIRLYNLRKYFRNHAGSGYDFVNFWMGHIAQLGVDKSYFSKNENKENIEKHRKIYADTALKNLRLESKTPNQTEEQILYYREELKSVQSKFNQLLEFVKSSISSEEQRKKLEELELCQPAEAPTEEELRVLQDDGRYPDSLSAENTSCEEDVEGENEVLKERVEELAGEVSRLNSELTEIKTLILSLVKK